ncbi:MAG: flagellar hook-basal body complex protein, partial [Clostridiales bacterium]|nr:flagellar hook-basal body complex protein [Clostridiales bacterium]
MMRSLFSGVSGLRVHQTKMDVIANNIANVNTVGYKSSRVTFMDAFYQRLQGGAGPSEETGRAGTNPMQIGLGANVGSIDNIMTQGASQRTDNSFDAMIEGSGFFIVQDESGTYFTRAGNIKVDVQNNLHINGMPLMGWDTVKDPATGQWVIESTPVKPLNLAGEKQYMPPVSTSVIDMIGNLNPNELPPSGKVERTMTFFDSVGTAFEVGVEFTYMGANQPNSYWKYSFVTGSVNGGPVGVLAYPNGDTTKPEVLAINIMTEEDEADDAYEPPTDMANSGVLVFNNEGTLMHRLDPPPDPSGPADANGAQTYLPDDLTAVTDDDMIIGKEISIAVHPISVVDPTAIFGDTSPTG